MWDANAEPDLASYNIYRSNTQGVYGAPVATVPAGAVNYLATGLQVGSTYYFTVTAVDTAGNESIRSNEVSRSVF
jgi:fibronectin type 3 domain-containing protein